MIAQKISNLCYPRGSVVYAQFDKKSEYYYLNMRPLIVVSNQTQMFDSLSVIGCGSRDRPGIQISLFNHQSGNWIGGHQYTVAQPYALFSIVASQIIEFHGVIDPWTMEAIDKAMAWHLGLSKEVPPYMQDIYTEIMEPAYSMGNENNTQLKDPHQLGSQNEITRKFVRIQPKTKKPDFGKPYPKKNEPVQLRPNTHTVEEVRKKLGITEEPKQEPQPEAKEETPSNGVTRIGTAKLYIPNEEECPFDDNTLSIACSLTDEEKIKVLTRQIEPGKYGKNGLITIWNYQIVPIRKALEYTYKLNEWDFAKKMANRLCHQQRNFRFLTEFEKVCAIMYGSPETLGLQESTYNDVAKQLIKQYHLDFSDGRYWRNYINLNRMKKIYSTIKK